MVSNGKISVLFLVASLILLSIGAFPGFSDVGANVSVSNVEPAQPTSAQPSQIYVHSLSAPNYAFNRGVDPNGDNVRTIFIIGTSGYGSTDCTNQGIEDSNYASGSATNLNAPPVTTPAICAYTYSTGTGSNATKNYSYTLQAQDYPGGSRNQTYPLNFSIFLYNSQPVAPSALNISEASPAPVAPPVASFTPSSDPDSDSITYWATVGTSSGGNQAMPRTQVSASGFSIPGAGLYNATETQNNTQRSMSRYYVNIFTFDGTAAGNANSSNYSTTFNITNTRPNITASINNASSAGAAVQQGQPVRFAVTFTEADATDSGTFTMRVCSTNAVSGSSCAGYQFCTNTRTGAGQVNCTYNTQNSDGNTNTTYAFVWDPRGLPVSTTNTTASTFYVDQGITFSNLNFGNISSFGTFVNGNTVQCNATIVAGDNVVKDVRFIIYGPLGSITDPDYISGNVSANCTGATWSGSGKSCNSTFVLSTTGTSQAGTCRHRKGTWTCVVNATNALDANKTSYATTDTQTMINSAPTVDTPITAWSGDTSISLVTNQGMLSMTTKGMNVTYHDLDGWDDINATSCASNECKVFCRNPDTVDNATAVSAFWNFTIKNFSASDGDAFNGGSGCQLGGNGQRELGLLPAFEAVSTNGTWACYARVADQAGASAWTGSTSFTVSESADFLFDESADDGTFLNNLFFIFSGTPGNRYTATIPDDDGTPSTGQYVVYHRVTSAYATVRYNGTHFTRGTDGSATIGVQNFTVGASSQNTIDCASASYNATCRPILVNDLRIIWGTNATFVDPIANYPTGVKRYVDGALLIPVGTVTGNYNATFGYNYCLTADDISCVDEG